MDTASADALENVVTLFEQFCRETFESIVTDADCRSDVGRRALRRSMVVLVRNLH